MTLNIRPSSMHVTCARQQRRHLKRGLKLERATSCYTSRELLLDLLQSEASYRVQILSDHSSEIEMAM